MSEEIEGVLDKENTINDNELSKDFLQPNTALSNLSMEELIIELNNLCESKNPYSVSKKYEEIKINRKK